MNTSGGSLPQGMPPPQIIKPRTAPSVPSIEPPMLSLPPSLPKQNLIPPPLNDNGEYDEDTELSFIPIGSARVDRGKGFSLTNNDFSMTMSMQSTGKDLKMGQSPTILSILSGNDIPPAGSLTQHHNFPQVRSSRASISYPSHEIPTIPDHHLEDDDEDEDDGFSLEISEELPFDFSIDGED